MPAVDECPEVLNDLPVYARWGRVTLIWQVCILGESMGATAALRYSRHGSGTVVALVPQIDVRDFEYAGRADFGDDRKVRGLTII